MKINIKRIDHVQLCIPKGEDKIARLFYLEILGFKEINKPNNLKRNGGFWCQNGSVEIHIGVENEPQGKSKRHPAFEIQNLHSVRNYLEKKGVKIKEDPPIPGRIRFSIFDPFNNRIEFLEYNESP
ncbi:VOC family protein [Bacillus carboniphilus]|uniref:VOC family protein n=1 Tax=Bacillus carboniphilus TaxID=86663 RepID=A0ABY9JWM2_9BACI|nr:VOC family protein [Bacillus carboniphilus]WLR43199.1 VOC family protein [Bacillus carboniphilus]